MDGLECEMMDVLMDRPELESMFEVTKVLELEPKSKPMFELMF